MKYSSGNPSGKKPVQNSKKKKSHNKSVAGKVGRVLLTVFLIFVITCTLVGGAIAFYVINFVSPQNINLSSANLDSTTFVYATDYKTNKPVKFSQISGEQNRIWISIKDMPDNLKNAFVCTEDQRFYEHEGVDWKRTIGSFGNLFLHFYGTKQGGSTITQQLVNNLTSAGKNSHDYGRKIQEIVNALDLEKRYGKEQILEAYLNTINLNEGCYGVETAAQNYFGKDVKNLDIAECAALACMPKAPSTYDPRNHPEKNTDRRVNVVLKNMYTQHKITKQQYDAAVKETLKIAAKPTVSTRGWFEDMVISDVQSDLEKQYGWTDDYALNTIYTKGLKIYSTMNPDIQNAMDKVYIDTTNATYWRQYSGTVQPQSSMIIVDYSGRILGVEGGRGQKSGNMVYNRAVDSRAARQPGSSLKPLGVYAPAIELNKINWSTPINCSKIMVGGKAWPQNDDDSNYSGTMPVVQALAKSVNTVAVHIDNDYLSPEYTFDFLKNKLGFDTLVDRKVVNNKVYSDKSISIAIGALTQGVTVKELAGGYEIFGNGGMYYKPYSYTKVLDSQGNVLLENKVTPKRAIGADTSFIMNKLLQSNVQRSDGTGQSAQISGVLVGGKTGTTNDHKDRWFAGITPDYVGIVWFGYDQPKDVGYNGKNPALVAWRSVFVNLPKVKTDYPTNGDVVQENFDPSSGYITSNGSEVGWFKANGNLPAAPVDPDAS
ncbi:MAG TPA: transglycosylase domain-containing protein [Ruminiclostridium sp.]|nr:transglycosylase domain-containing protein [Ruminiclostridium sp.]